MYLWIRKGQIWNLPLRFVSLTFIYYNSSKGFLMNKQNLLTLTLILSGLVLTPAVAEVRVDMESAPTQTQNINHSVTSGISSVLYNRGLDEDVAEELAANFVEAEDEMFLSMLLQTLDAKNIVSHEEVLDYLSTAALHRQSIDFKSYDNLVGMVAKIKKCALDENTLKQLSYLSHINKQLFV